MKSAKIILKTRLLVFAGRFTRPATKGGQGAPSELLFILLYLVYFCPPNTSGGAIRSLPRDEGVEELHGDPTFGPRPKAGAEVKIGRSGAKDGAPETLGCGTVKEEVSQILQRV